MKKLFTGNKDIDLIILQKLSDIDISVVSAVGNYASEICNSDVFWYGRLKSRFPYFLSQKPQNITPRNYYFYLSGSIFRVLQFISCYMGDSSQYALENLPKVCKDGALKYVSENGDLKLVKYLVEKGADVHASGNSPLSFASEKGHLEVVKYLVEKGADVCVHNNLALRIAGFKGHLEIVKYLVENGADIYAYDNEVLRDAIRNGHTELVEYLESIYGLQIKKL